MKAYIEIVTTVCERHELDRDQLAAIGDFTRKSIANWLIYHPLDGIGPYGWQDFHAVCGDIDIPWETEKAKNLFAGMYSPEGHYWATCSCADCRELRSKNSEVDEWFRSLDWRLFCPDCCGLCGKHNPEGICNLSVGHGGKHEYQGRAWWESRSWEATHRP